MNKSLFRKLAFNSIKNNKTTFIPYALACTTMIALFFMMASIKDQVANASFYGASSMKAILSMGVIIIGIFSVFVIFYTNSFLLKRRTKELGLYNVLGLEKKHISRVLLWETTMVGFASIVMGIALGLLFSKLIYLVFLNIVNLKSNIEFGFSITSVVYTVILYLIVFVATIIYNTFRIYLMHPVEMLRNSKAGEKEPKAKWILAILGLVSLGIGYVMALNTKNPLEALSIFFIAVLFVIVGTYLLFLSGSIALLKILKNNKKYYYHKTHFISVSGMIYRMKQNAVGLANICILSTAVIVVLTTTTALYLGNKDVLDLRFPRNVMTEMDCYDDGKNRIPAYDENEIAEVTKNHASKYDLTVKNIQTYYDYSCVGTFTDDGFDPNYQMDTDFVTVQLITAEDYNRMTGENLSVTGNDVILYSSTDKYKEYDKFRFGTEDYNVVGTIDEYANKSYETDSFDNIRLIVADTEVMFKICEANNNVLETYKVYVAYEFNYDLEGKDEDKLEFCKTIRDAINNNFNNRLIGFDDKFNSEDEIMSLFGSLFFIGLFIGTLFIIVTVLIIYYKQISEGHDDRERFVIMQKVGMSKQEVKKVINGQILSVFFLPILLAVVHVIVAFDIIKKMLRVLGLINVQLYVMCMIGTIIAFVIVYAIVYVLTARTYYKIVND